MGFYRTPEVNDVTVADCGPVGDHWNELHMPCWICDTDRSEMRNELMWSDPHSTYFHRTCLEEKK